VAVPVLYGKERQFHVAYVVSYVEDRDSKSVPVKIRNRYAAADLVTHEFCREKRIEDATMQCIFF
jgi:hypothetical protein